MPKKSIVPLAVLGAGFVWLLACHIIRRRSASSTGTQGADGNQKLLLVGIGGLVLAMIAGAIAAALLWSR